MQKLGPTLLAAFGLALLLFCIYTEGEPTAVPPLLLVIAGLWYAVARFRGRAKVVR